MNPRTSRVLMTADTVGGVWTYALTLGRALSRRGFRVTLAATGAEPTHAQRHDAHAAGVDARFRPLRCEWMHPPLADVANTAAWLDALTRDFRPHVVHLNDYALAARIDTHVPKVVVAHSDVVSWHRHVLDAEPDATWDAYRAAVATGLDAADAVVAPSHAVLNDLATSFDFAGTGCVIPNAVDDTHPPAAARDDVVFSAGRMWDPAKNLATLAAAAPRIAGRVVVAGQTETTHDAVTSVGTLSHDAVRRLMTTAAVYALPARYEPFGLSAVEAALGGCALVLGDIASLREVWGDAATFVPPGDARELADVTNTLLNDPDARTTLARRGRARALRYAVKPHADAYADLYASLL